MTLTMGFDDDLRTHPGVGEGERHTTLCRLVGIHRARGDDGADIEAWAVEWAARCTPAYPESDSRRNVHGLLAAAGKWRGVGPANGGVRAEGGDVQRVREGTNAAAAGAELVPSLPATSAVATDADHGLFGAMLAAIAPETEADPAGVLLGWLACFGNIVGRGAWQRVGPRLHHPALYVGIVGLTSDAKGDGWAAALWPFQQVEPEWASTCIAHGVGSGEGLIERITDDRTVLDRGGEVVLVPGAADKRLLVRLPELSRCFKLGRRENATLSEYLREAWDGEPIHVPDRKGNALSTTGYAVSVCGDVTPGVVRKLLESGTEGFDGFANRFLWAVVRSGRDLPSGGDITVLGPFLGRLQAALSFAKTAGEMRRDAEAEALWGEVYPALKRSGDDVPHTDRARPHVLRLSMIYALADCSAVIGTKHLRAALAVWERCRAAAQTLFVTPPTNAKVPNPLWLSLLSAITQTPGVSRTALREVAGHKTPAEEIEAALSYLTASGWLTAGCCNPRAGAGRPSAGGRD